LAKAADGRFAIILDGYSMFPDNRLDAVPDASGRTRVDLLFARSGQLSLKTMPRQQAVHERRPTMGMRPATIATAEVAANQHAALETEAIAAQLTTMSLQKAREWLDASHP
jgi:hypothetical protein